MTRKPAGGRRRRPQPPPRQHVRAHLVSFVFCLGFCLMAVRAAQLSLLGPPAPASASVPAAPKRADLVDRNGLLLAATAPTYAVQVRRDLQWDAEETVRGLRRVLPMLDAAALRKRLSGERGAVLAARRLTPAQRDAVFALGLPGVEFVEQPARFYPRRATGAHVIGDADAGLRGRSGLERAFEESLLGAETPQAAALDLRLQHALEAEIEAGRRLSGARYGAGVLLDGRTGEVLALASLPSFDGNRPPPPKDPLRLNRALGAVYEYGSILKPFTVAMALEAGLTSPAERFDLSPLQAGGREIADPHPLEPGAGLADILAESSNVGAAILALRLGAARQGAGLAALGLAQGAPLPLAEAAEPLFPAAKDPYTVAARGFGHGVSVSLLAVARAYTVFVNDGEMVQLRLRPVVEGEEITRTRVFAPAVAVQVRLWLRGVVERGTGQRADILEAAIAGKTGTGEKYGPGGYDAARNVASFAALLPAQQPRYVLLVALDEPRADGAGTGGALAAPIAARIAARIAPMLRMQASAGPVPGEQP
jgi:cell division protein FtsI (penicillin-binding protein 3)